MKKTKIRLMKNFLVDVDGVLNTGQFLYNTDGKAYKIFGPDDNDGLGLLKGKLTIHMISGDKRGYAITHKRVVEDMKFPLAEVSTFERVDWIKEHFNLEETIYMGDGIFDALVFDQVAYSIAPANAFYKTKEKADFVTQSKGGEGAVAEACVHILEKFFDGFDLSRQDFTTGVGVWYKGAHKK